MSATLNPEIPLQISVSRFQVWNCILTLFTPEPRTRDIQSNELVFGLPSQRWTASAQKHRDQPFSSGSFTIIATMTPMTTSARENQKFRRACKNLMWRCDKVHTKYGVKVYIIIQRGGKTEEYTSTTDEQDWPPSREYLVSSLVNLFNHILTSLG